MVRCARCIAETNHESETGPSLRVANRLLLKDSEEQRQHERQRDENNPQVFNDATGDMPCVCGHIGARVKWAYLRTVRVVL
jgi:hypothetical protein